MKILNFKHIVNFGVFQQFDWDSNLSYEGKQAESKVYDFKTINILYGRNYSGKTSLSKIVRSYQTQQLPANYGDCNFQIEYENGEKTDVLNSNNLAEFNHSILVYNTDFVREHLGFIIDDTKDIRSFSVTLGEQNIELLDEISGVRNELGNDVFGSETGLYKDKVDATQACDSLKLQLDQKTRILQDSLKNKALKIKQDTSQFNAVNYIRTTLEADIKAIYSQSNYAVLTVTEREKYRNTIASEHKVTPPVCISSVPSLLLLIEKVRVLCETEIGQADKITELMENAALNQWVQHGLTLHQDKKTCAFCESELSTDRLVALRQHFNDEMKALQADINVTISELNTEKLRLSEGFNVDTRDYYFWLGADLESELQKLNIYASQQEHTIGKLMEFLNSKRDNLFQKFSIEKVHDFQVDIENSLRTINEIRTKHCNFTNEMMLEKKAAQEKLRLQEVYDFCQQIAYQSKQQELAVLEGEIARAQQKLTDLVKVIRVKANEIIHLEKQFKNEAAACQKINNILTHEFGHPYLSLDAVEKHELDNKEIKFEILRDGEKAHNLSEGEQSLISFCYFLVSVEEAMNKGLQPIIWIDDPICSLDSNHIFFIFFD